MSPDARQSNLRSRQVDSTGNPRRARRLVQRNKETKVDRSVSPPGREFLILVTDDKRIFAVVLKFLAMFVDRGVQRSDEMGHG